MRAGKSERKLSIKIKESTKKWIEAGKKNETNSNAKLIYPECEVGYLVAKVEQIKGVFKKLIDI